MAAKPEHLIRFALNGRTLRILASRSVSFRPFLFFAIKLSADPLRLLTLLHSWIPRSGVISTNLLISFRLFANFVCRLTNWRKLIILFVQKFEIFSAASICNNSNEFLACVKTIFTLFFKKILLYESKMVSSFFLLFFWWWLVIE